MAYRKTSPAPFGSLSLALLVVAPLPLAPPAERPVARTAHRQRMDLARGDR